MEMSLSMPLSKTPANMRVKSVQELTSQVDKSWLKEKAFWNMVFIFLTLETSQPPILALNNVACSNMPDIS